jgi:hypothetical protein
VLLVAVVIGAILIWSWLNTPAPVVPAEHYPEQATRAFMVVHMRPDHAQYVAGADTLVEQAPVGGGRNVRVQTSDPEKLKKMLPVQLVMVLRPAEEGAEQKFRISSVFAMSRFLRGMTWVMRKSAASSDDVVTWLDEDVPMIRSEDGQDLLTPLENTVFVTPDTELAAVWLERHRAALELGDPEDELAVPELDVEPRLKEAYARLDREVLLKFVALNADGELQFLMEKMDPDLTLHEEQTLLAVLEKVISLAGQVNPVEENTGELKLFVEVPDEETATELQQVIQEISKDEKTGESPELEYTIGEGYDGAVMLTVQGRIKHWARRISRAASAAPKAPQSAPSATPEGNAPVPQNTESAK